MCSQKNIKTLKNIFTRYLQRDLYFLFKKIKK